MKRFYVYILRCRDGTLYSGSTEDVQRRVREHNIGKGSKYVRSRGGGVVVHTETFTTRSRALMREAAIKKLRRKDKFRLFTV